MEPKEITIIAIVAVVAVLLVALCVFLIVKKKKGNKTEKEVVNDSKDLVAANAQTIEVLLVLADGKEDLCRELREMQDKLKYLTPSTDERVKQIDEKIRGELGDLKIELSKKKPEDKDDKAAAHLDNIRVKIAERSVLTDRL